MPAIARSLVALGVVLLMHAAYSAYEHTQLHSLSSSSSHPAAGDENTSSLISDYLPALKAPTASFSIGTLPTDITLETLIALFLLTSGIVLSSEPLKPIRWNEWAAEVEHGKHGKSSRYMKKEGEAARLTTEELGQKLYGGPNIEGFGWLEDGRRMGFFDIRARRKEFAEWVRKEGKKET